MSDDPRPMFDAICEGDLAVITMTRSTLGDEDNIDLLGESLQDIVTTTGIKRLVLDLAHMTHVTSSVLGKWITLHRSIHRDGGRMVICGVGDSMNEIFSATRLHTLFEIADDVTAARDLLGAN